MPGPVEIDLTEINEVAVRLRQAAKIFQREFVAIVPEFGAYMSYSLFLEVGTKKMAARPHILQAITFHAGTIRRALLDEILDLTSFVVKHGHATVKSRLTRAWIRVLNDKPRVTAVANAPFEFDFHRRSIRGYARERTPSEVLALQSKASSKREAKQAGT